VLNRHLEGKQYLVGDKCTYADLSFVPWNYLLSFLMGDQDLDVAKEFPRFTVMRGTSDSRQGHPSRRLTRSGPKPRQNTAIKLVETSTIDQLVYQTARFVSLQVD